MSENALQVAYWELSRNFRNTFWNETLFSLLFLANVFLKFIIINPFLICYYYYYYFVQNYLNMAYASTFLSTHDLLSTL